jgi:RNA polymerase sigma-70 factor, ECF subfamily
MAENDWLAERFEEHRAHLRAVAYRMLGSRSEADDAVQEAWLRLSRADRSDVENLGGWLTTVVARVSLNMLRSRDTRREEPFEEGEPEPAVPGEAGAADPEQEALLADSVGIALLVVLDTLTPAERLAFVLHDMFAVPFEEIAGILDRSPEATRQLASRARRRVRSAGRTPDSDLLRQRQAVSAFLAAAREGDFEGLLAILAPDVVVRADQVAVAAGAEAEVRGPDAVAGTFAGRARAARVALIDGAFGLAWAPGGKPRVVFVFTIEDGKIAAIDLLSDPERLQQMDLAMVAR